MKKRFLSLKKYKKSIYKKSIYKKSMKKSIKSNRPKKKYNTFKKVYCGSTALELMN